MPHFAGIWNGLDSISATVINHRFANCRLASRGRPMEGKNQRIQDNEDRLGAQPADVQADTQEEEMYWMPGNRVVMQLG